MSTISCVVIGAGCVGLATARALSLIGLEVIVLEKNSSFGTETSSRSSEVLHSGIYYPTNSNKARFCVEGNNLLINYLKERKISHNLCGKLIIATSKKENEKLQSLYKQGEKNGLNALKLCSQEDVRVLEPNVECTSAILSPTTAIFDTHSVMLNYLGDIEDNGSNIVYNCSFNKATLLSPTSSRCSSLFEVETSQGNINCNYLINAAGLYSQLVASKIKALNNNSLLKIPTAYYAKGYYYKLVDSEVGKYPFNKLIYPLPSDGGLGIHATLDLNNEIRFGPNVEWITNERKCDENISNLVGSDIYAFNDWKDDNDTIKIDYNINDSEERKKEFIHEIKKYFPVIKDDQVVPDYSGIRPKLVGPNAKNPADFLIHGPETHLIPGLINLYGIESPGWTSSLAISDFIVSKYFKNR